MSVLTDRTRTVVSLLAYYWNRPSRWHEVPTWARDRGTSTLDIREPWWNRPAMDAVERVLTSESRVFEFGGGGSTLWLADRVAEVFTVEHDKEWFGVLTKLVPANVRLELRQPIPHGSIGSTVAPEAFFDDYVHAIAEQPDDSFNLVIVDGRARVDCGRAAIPKLKSGGMLFLDDSDRQRYNPLFQDLRPWNRVDYRGLKRVGGGIAQSTIWIRP